MEKLLNYSGLEKYNDMIHDELDQKANIDGYYESLGSGTADQLSSNIFEEDSEPYHFRTSGGSIDIGDRETDMLVGGTVAWNQLCGSSNARSVSSQGVTFDYDAQTNTWTASGTANAGNRLWLDGINNAIAGHKILITTDSKQFLLFSFSNGNKYGSGIVVNCAESSFISGVEYYGVVVVDGTTYSDTFHINCIDLTQMFGSTIADYIYTLEQGQAGAGVAFFRKYFPKLYYPYDAGTIKSVEGVSAHKTVGFNQWDEEWVNGYYKQADGEFVSNSSFVACKNKIKVLPSTAYYVNINATHQVLFYDANENFISAYSSMTSPRLYTTPANCYYITFYVGGTYGTTYNNDICINLSWDGERNGEYEPYVEHSYPLDDSLTLRGIPKIANGKLYYYGDKYPSDGNGTERFALVDLGTLDWVLVGSTGHFRFRCTNTPSDMKDGVLNQVSNIMCSSTLTPDTYNNVYGDVTDKTICVAYGNEKLCIYWSQYTDATQFKSALSGIYLLYEKATPTPFTATPFTNPQIVDDFGTEEYVTTSIVPVGHYTQYMANLKAKLEMSPDSPNGAGDYIVRQSNGENEYVSLASNATIQDIIARLEALEGGGE